MPHQYYVKARPCGEGEWKADAKKGNKVVATVYALSRQEAIEEIKKKMPEDKRFSVDSRPTKKTRGFISTVTDHKTGEKWVGTGYDYSASINAVEPDLPKAYFYEKHGEHNRMNARHEWAEHHVFKSFVLPVLCIFIPIATILILTGIIKL